MSSENPIVPKRTWFLQGAMLGVLITGTLNALSYFVRSGGWGSLLGDQIRFEAMGFPAELWAGDGYHVHTVSFVGLAANLGFTVGLSVLLGIATLICVRPLNRLVDSFEFEPEESYRLQFSLRSLLLVTLIVSVVSAVANATTWSPKLLGGIYLFGPLSLILVAMIPRRIPWQQRIAIVMPGAVCLIALALFIGLSIGISVDKVLLGIFACWTPQSAIAAIGITAVMLFKSRHVMLPQLRG